MTNKRDEHSMLLTCLSIYLEREERLAMLAGVCNINRAKLIADEKAAMDGFGAGFLNELRRIIREEIAASRPSATSGAFQWVSTPPSDTLPRKKPAKKRGRKRA